MKLIDKDAVVAELEKLYNLEYYNTSNLSCGKKIMLRHILFFLDHIEAKDEGFKPTDSDFERDAVNFCIDNGLNTTPYIAKTIAKHFFELGLKHRKENRL